jgi:hypothetical protein
MNPQENGGNRENKANENKGPFNVATKCAAFVGSVYQIASDMPGQMYNSVVKAGGEVAKSLRGYTDALQGKGDPSNVVLAKVHFAFIEKIRNNEPEKYKALLAFANKYPSIPYDDQPMRLINLYKMIDEEKQK